MALAMAAPLLPEGWRDVLALASLVATLLGFAIAIWQIRKTKSAAEAARAAAKNTSAEVQKSYGHFTIGIAHRLITEVMSHVQKENWELASLRLNDLADQVVLLVSSDPEWKNDSTQLRKWADVCFRQLHADGTHTFDRDKWSKYFLKFHSKIDIHFGPYPVAPEMTDDTF